MIGMMPVNLRRNIKLPFFNWYSVDNEERFLANKSKLKKHGWVQKDGSPLPIKYHINRDGFRHDGSHKDYMSGGVMYIGDSDIFGVGNSLEDTFTYLAHYNSNLKDKPYYNFGLPSMGIETYYRTIEKWIPRINPYALFLFLPWEESRCEIWNPFKQEYSYIHLNTERKKGKRPTEELMRYFDKEPSHTRLNKNLAAIEWICHTNNTHFLYVDSLPHDEHHSARDLLHHGPDWHNVASTELVEYINDV